MGAACVAASLVQGAGLPAGTAAAWVGLGASGGLLGSLLDSLLGATLQATWFDKVCVCRRVWPRVTKAVTFV